MILHKKMIVRGVQIRYFKIILDIMKQGVREGYIDEEDASVMVL